MQFSIFPQTYFFGSSQVGKEEGKSMERKNSPVPFLCFPRKSHPAAPAVGQVNKNGYKKCQIHKKINKTKRNETKEMPCINGARPAGFQQKPDVGCVAPQTLLDLKSCYAYTQKWDTWSLNTHPHEKVAHKICGTSIWQCLISTCSRLSRLRGKFRLERYHWHSELCHC